MIGQPHGLRFVPLRADISRRIERGRLLAATLKAFGRIDALVNNAGIAPRRRSDMLEASESSFCDLIRTNLQGPHFLTQIVARHWLKKRPAPALPNGFTVIFVTSISAEILSLNRSDYCVSKAGYHARELGLLIQRLAQGSYYTFFGPG
jgi:3-oxoacyl-[acyl-carrier protein] reductase